MVKDGYYAPRGGDGVVYGQAFHNGPWQKEEYLFTYTLDYLLHHPAEAGQRILTKAYNMWQPDLCRQLAAQLADSGLPYCVEMLCCLAGLVIAWRRRLACPALAIPLGFFFVPSSDLLGRNPQSAVSHPLAFHVRRPGMDALSRSKLVSRLLPRWVSSP